MKWNLIPLLFVIVLLSVVSISAFEPHQQDTPFELLISSNNASSCNWTYIKYPDNTKNYTNLVMTKQGQDFNYSIEAEQFSQLGTTCLGITCLDGTNTETGSVCKEVTLNGNEPAEGILVVVFTLIFIAIIFFGIIYFFKSLAHVMQFDMDLIDTAIMMGTYFAMWIFYYFSFEYLGNAFINDMLETAISVGAVTHVFLPLVAFMVSFIMTNLKFKQKQRITY